MNGSIFNTCIYDDKICNFGICENCIKELPEKRDNKHMKKLINNQDQCECGNNLCCVPSEKSNCHICDR